MPQVGDAALARAVMDHAWILHGENADFDPLLARAHGKHFVLIGEASHGTHDFYRLRAELTKRLIREQGFRAVAIEGDWPDAYRINRYVRGLGSDAEAVDALADFRRFPAWMWRNADVLDFIGWLRAYNDKALLPQDKVGFYGLDLYSLHASMDAVLAYLDKADKEAARRARLRYACFEQYGEDPQVYGYKTTLGLGHDCEEAVVSQLIEMQRHRDLLLRRDGLAAEDEFFHAQQNALIVKDAEQYYRSMFHDHITSWNLRDRHMADTLDALTWHLSRNSGDVRVVVWAHNSHVGDARATQMGQQGETNIGQLMRERHPTDTLLVGFSTYSGTVTAASDWGAPAERKRVRKGMSKSYEELFHLTGIPGFLLPLWDPSAVVASGLREPRLQRAIGVIYKPETERLSHYFYASLPEQFDALFHLDETRALEPLERTSSWEAGEEPETYPTGI